MLNTWDVDAFVMLAGPDFRWDSEGAPKQLDSRHRQGLTILLAQAQSGICVACGDPLAGERTDLCHIVASRVSGRGVMPGNVYVGHASCNDADAKEFGDVVPLDSLASLDLLPMTFPTRQECLRAAKHLADVRQERLDYRRSLIVV